MKRLLKYLLYRLYQSGHYEARERNAAVDRQRKAAQAIFDDTVKLEGAVFKNQRGSKEAIQIGSHTVIEGELLTFRHGGQIHIGEYCFVGESSRIWSSKKITIGNRVLISHNVNIHDNNSHSIHAAQRHQEFRQVEATGKLPQHMDDLEEEEIVIGDDAWIGFNAIIFKGVTIGKGAIVGAGTIVTKNVPDFAVAVGNPVTIIKSTD